MSYSFSVTAPGKDAVVREVKEQMASVVAGQPVHARDQDLIETSVASAAALLADDASRDVGVAVCGSLIWSGENEPGKESLESVSVSVTAWLSARTVK